MLPRVLEPEVMDTVAEAVDYNSMDHSEVNRLFVDNFLDALKTCGLFPSTVAGEKPGFSEKPGFWGADSSKAHPSPWPLKILDAGTTETGRPYFVMELVRGIPTTSHIRAQTPSRTRHADHGKPA